MRVARAAGVSIAAALALGSIACESPSAAPAQPNLSPPRPEAIHPRRDLIPLPQGGGKLKVTGDYIQVTGMPGSDRVNEMLHRLVLDSLAGAQRTASSTSSAPGSDPGEYAVRGVEADFLATDSVVSVLIPVSFQLPGGGTPLDGWLALTVRAPLGEPVAVTDLFTDPAAALNALGREVIKELRADSCVGEVFDSFQPHVDWDTAEPYSRFSLTAAGLALGFDKYQVGPGACGPVRVVVPWTELSRLMTREALGWVASPPKTTPSQLPTG
jgi:hypothetical protein